MGQMKKAGLVLLLAAIMAWGRGSPVSEAYTINLIPTFLEHRADVSALYGGSADTDTSFSIASYQNTYPQQPGIDAWHSITLKDPSSATLFQWSGDLSGKSAALSLQSGEIYTLLVESHGDFGDQVLLGGIASGSFLSMAELKIRVSEQVAIPAPDSLVLLLSALGGWLALRKKIALWRGSHGSSAPRIRFRVPLLCQGLLHPDSRRPSELTDASPIL